MDSIVAQECLKAVSGLLPNCIGLCAWLLMQGKLVAGTLNRGCVRISIAIPGTHVYSALIRDLKLPLTVLRSAYTTGQPTFVTLRYAAVLLCL